MPVRNREKFLCIGFMHRYLMKAWHDVEYAKMFSLFLSDLVSLMLGRGYVSPIVFLFSARKPITIRHLLLSFEFLRTTRTDELYGEFDSLITSFINKSFTCLLTSSLWIEGNLYYLMFIIDCGHFMCGYIGMA